MSREVRANFFFHLPSRRTVAPRRRKYFENFQEHLGSEGKMPIQEQFSGQSAAPALSLRR